MEWGKTLCPVRIFSVQRLQHMKQVLQDKRSGAVEVHDLPTPALRAGFLLVRNAVSLISTGTERAVIDLGRSSLLGKALKRPDLVRKVIQTARTRGLREAAQAVSSRLDEPTPLGYSCAGTVIEAGPEVSRLAPGERVACAGYGYASHAEFVTVPKNLVVRIPDGVGFEQASFVAVGSIALHGVRLSEAGIGDTVVVIGLGLIGLLAGQILRAGGSQVVGIDVSEDRCRVARDLGIDHVFTRDAFSAESILQITEGRGADAVVIAAAAQSNDPVELAGAVARDRACVSVVGNVGMDIPRDLYYAKELSLRLARSYGPGRYDPSYEEQGLDYPTGYVPWPEGRNMQGFLKLLDSGAVSVDGLISGRYPMARAPEAYETLDGSEGPPPIALVLTYAPDSEPARRIDAPRERSAAPGNDGVSFIGTGRFARATLLPKFVHHGAKLRGAVTRTATSAAAAEGRFKFAFTTTDVTPVLEDADTAAVVIATRHDSHSRLAADALRAGKHVYLEKPLALDRTELEQVLAAAAASDRLLVVGYNRRFAPLALQLKRELASCKGPTAIVYRVNVGALPPDHWTRDPEIGGGRIVGEACHFVDLLQFLTGSEPVHVSADAVPPADGGSADTVSFQIKFADGSVGTVHYFSIGDPRLPKERLEVFAPNMSAVLEDFRRLDVYRGGKLRRKQLRSQDKGHDNLVETFLNLCRKGGLPPIPYRDLGLTSLVTFLVNESLREGVSRSVEM
jgi:predicted dehydrogenase